MAALGTLDTLTSDQFAPGDDVFCTVTPDDGETSGDPVDSNTVTVNHPPEVASLTLSPLPATTDDDLTCSAMATDADGDAVTASYTWTVEGVDVGVTSDTLDAGRFTGSQLVVCTATLHDGLEEGGPASVSTVVANTAPHILAVELSPSELFTEDEVVADVTVVDADGDIASLSYTWFVDGAPVEASGDTLAGEAYFDKGQDVHVVVVPFDGRDEGTHVSSATSTVSNSPPAGLVVEIEPDEAEAGERLVCVIETEASDADGDDVTFTFSWDAAGASYAGTPGTTFETGDTIDEDETDEGEVWACSVTPHDGEHDGAVAQDSTRIGGFDGWESATVSFETADIVLYGARPYDFIGVDTQGSADLDGDGLAEVAIGSEGGGRGFAGAVHLFWGSSLVGEGELDLSDADVVFVGENSGDEARSPVSWIGDVDGDGIEDLALGAEGLDVAGTDAGGVYVVLGDSVVGAAGEVDLGDADFVFHGERAGDELYRVHGAGDIDSDGLDDLLMGSRLNDDGGTDAGKAYVFLAGGLGASPSIDVADSDVHLVGEVAGDSAGRFVRGDGDVDGDGIPDVAVTAWYSDSGGSTSGQGYLLLGSTLAGRGRSTWGTPTTGSRARRP